MNGRRLLLALTAAAVVATAVPSVQASGSSRASLPARQEELRRIQRQLEEERERLLQARRRERRASDEVQRFDRDREGTEERLARLWSDLRRARVRADAAAAALARAEMSLSRRRTVLAGRLRDLHRYGRAGYLDVVLGASSFPEFVARARMVGAVVRSDARLITVTTEDRDQVAALREALDVEQARLQGLVRETEERRRELVVQVAAKRRVLRDIVNERAAAERAIRDLEEDSAELEALIRRLQAGVAAGPGWARVASVWPLRGPITSRFGLRVHPLFRLRQFHQGVDISAPTGTPVRAALDGSVLFAGWFGGYGKLVVIDHGEGISTLYGHLSAILVKPGQPIARGDMLGRVGSTGYSTGPHLHFEVRQNGRPIDPAR